MSTSNPENYLLPCSESYTCLDRFSICSEDVEEDEYGRIPFWPLFKTLLKAQIQHHAQLVDLLESIAVVLRDMSGPAGDYGLLKRFLENRPRFVDDIWPKLAALALELPDLFPGDSLPVLQSSETDRVVLSRRQAACLVVHQFLCTLAPPAWKNDNIYQFDVWYNSQQRQDTAPLAYLEALFLYFEQGAGNLDIWSNSTESWSVSYSLRSSPVSSVEEDTPGLSLPLTTLKVTNVDHYDTVPAALGVPGGATVISANKYIGFGQSATQEEIHVGISPGACPAVLITPPLQTDEALVVKGAQAMVNLIGQRRDIRSEAMPQPEGGMQAWRERTMLFIDALEIDMISDEHGLPDLFPDHVDREINKAALAFRSGRYDAVRTGIWGCGAFGGDPGVKMLAMWCAASLAGTNLDLYVDGWQRESAGELEVFVQKAEGKLKTVGDLRSLLLSAPKDLKRLETLQWFSQALD